MNNNIIDLLTHLIMAPRIVSMSYAYLLSPFHKNLYLFLCTLYILPYYDVLCRISSFPCGSCHRSGSRFPCLFLCFQLLHHCIAPANDCRCCHYAASHYCGVYIKYHHFHFLPAWSRPGFAALRPLRLYLLFFFFCFFFSCSSIIARSLSAAASGL